MAFNSGAPTGRWALLVHFPWLLFIGCTVYPCSAFRVCSTNRIRRPTTGRGSDALQNNECSHRVIGHHSHSALSPNHPSASSRLHSSSLSSSVRVYDDVFDSETCRALHELSVAHSERSTDGSSVFVRPDYTNDDDGTESTSTTTPALTPIETAIDSALRHLNDDSKVVEYWSRDVYINVDAHADIDENTLKDEGVLRCPRNGHVLYMQVAKEIRGPTCVFPTKRVAWGKVSPILGSGSGNEYVVDVPLPGVDVEEEEGMEGRCSNNDRVQEMVVVPAVEGRLLRFDGAAFHSVPKPAERYLLSKKEIMALDKDDDEDCDEDDDDDDDWYYDDEEDDDDEDSETKVIERSVLLFNTWPTGGPGPRGVLTDTVSTPMPEGIVISGNDDGGPSYEDKMEAERIDEWREAYGRDYASIQCRPIDEWNEIKASEDDDEKEFLLRVPLMGNKSRRGCDEIKASLMGPQSTAEAFRDEVRPSFFRLENDGA